MTTAFRHSKRKEMIINSGLFLLTSAASRQNVGLMKYGFGLSIPLLIIGFIALIITIVKFVKMFRDAQVSRVSLKETNEVEINKTGDLNLSLQAPALTVFPGQGLDYKLINQRDGREIKLEQTSTRSLSRRNSFSAITFPVRNFRIADAGKYLLKVTGINPQTDYSGYFLIVEQPTSLKSVVYILLLILTGGIFMLGFVFTLIALNTR